MEDILYDYHIAKAMAEHEAGDNNAATYKYVQAVFRKHGVSEADFDSSMVWYSRDASMLCDIYKHVNSRLEDEANALGADAGSISVYKNLTSEGDTANVWSSSDFVTLVGDELSNLKQFEIKSDTSYHNGDFYKLIFNSNFLQSFGAQEAYVTMQIKYDNDSIYALSQRLFGTNVELTVADVPQRSDWRTKSIKITFFLPIDNNANFRVCCLSDIKLVRFHKIASANNPVLPDSIQNRDTIMADTVGRDVQPDTSANKEESPLDKPVPEVAPSEKPMAEPRHLQKLRKQAEVVPDPKAPVNGPNPNAPVVKWK